MAIYDGLHVFCTSERPLYPRLLELEFDDFVRYLESRLRYPIKTATTVYQSEPERLAVVPILSITDLHGLIVVCQQLGQESVLVSDGKRNELIFISGPRRGMVAQGEGVDKRRGSLQPGWNQLDNSSDLFRYNVNLEPLVPFTESYFVGKSLQKAEFNDFKLNAIVQQLTFEKTLHWPAAFFFERNRRLHTIYPKKLTLPPFTDNEILPLLGFLHIPDAMRLRSQVMQLSGVQSGAVDVFISDEMVDVAVSSDLKPLIVPSTDNNHTVILPDFANFDKVLRVVLLDYLLGCMRTVRDVCMSQDQSYVFLPLNGLHCHNSGQLMTYLHKSLLMILFGDKWADHVPAVSSQIVQWWSGQVVPKIIEIISQWEPALTPVEVKGVVKQFIQRSLQSRLEEVSQWMMGGMQVNPHIAMSVKITQESGQVLQKVLDAHSILLVNWCHGDHEVVTVSDLLKDERIPAHCLNLPVPPLKLLEYIAQWLSKGSTIAGLAILDTITDLSHLPKYDEHQDSIKIIENLPITGAHEWCWGVS